MTATDETAVKPPKPLNASQVRMLRQLIANDYEKARSNLEITAREYLDAGKREIEAAHEGEAEAAQELAQRGTDLRRELNRQWQDYLIECRQAGFSLQKGGGGPYGYENLPPEATELNIRERRFMPDIPVLVSSAKKREIKALEDRVTDTLIRARQDLRHLEIDAERNALLKGVTPELAEELIAIPSAQETYLGAATAITGRTAATEAS